MEVCTAWFVFVFVFLSSAQFGYTSVNTSLDPKVTTSQSSNYSSTHISDEVVDDCTTQVHASGCCSHTAGNPNPNEAWWQINLGDQIVIDYVQIYYRAEGNLREQKTRFAGHEIFLTNTTDWGNSDRCQLDTTSLQTQVNLTPRITTCTGNTRYLTIYVDRRTKTYDWYSDNAILELCEVQVFGCPVGSYGNGNCDSSCDISCVNSLCHPGSGHCTYCAAGFYKSGRICTACPQNCLNDVCDIDSGICAACIDEFHGDYCNQPCPENCQNKTCSQNTGMCTACINGFHGNRCNQSCPETCLNKTCDQSSGKCTACNNGYYGEFCDQQCPDNCKDKICHKDSGNCEACISGLHGNQCNQSCPEKCLNKTCDQTSGKCTACINGYYNDLCDQQCPDTCKDKICHKDSGNCEDCEDYFFGPRCVACSENCADPVCDKTNGNCSHCKTGFFGMTCDKNCSVNCDNNTCIQSNGRCIECLVGFHGHSCNQTCPSNCKDNTCSQEYGNCTTGCDSGYHGSICQHSCRVNCKNHTCSQDTGICKGCKPGKYDSTCDRNCTSNCRNSECDQTYGQCIECTAGYFTSDCNQSCPVNCKNSLCNRTSGECSDCTKGFHGNNCSSSCSDLCTSAGCLQNTGQCIACVSGYYGMQCAEKCGQCVGESCGMTNGTCQCKDGWEGETCLTRAAMMSASEDQTAVYAGGAAGAVVFIALLVILTGLLILRRKRLASYKENPREKSAELNVSLDSSPTKLERQNTYEPAREQRESIAVASKSDERAYVKLPETKDDPVYNNVSTVSIQDLRSIIDKKMVNKAEAFQEEFKTFPWGAVHPHEVGKRASNRPKNRFKTTFPYDHSRVILETIGNEVDASYTNANYLDSVEAPKKYIACQGPKPNTLDDFWRMVWQVNAGKIVMLTNVMEKGIVKCHQYWPDEEEPLSTQAFHLKLDTERTYAFYTIRDISIVQKKTKEERLVQQFHFTTWPDHGTPDTLELVLFHRRVMSYKTLLPGQMVVHCSAGLGRTGTFVGLDALLFHGKKTGQVDIPSYIRIMRKDRMNMIQTYEQYIALHELLVEGFNLQKSHITRKNFPAVLATMCTTNTPANQTKIHEEFRALQTFSPSYTPSSYKAALSKVNKDKNRNMDILAGDKFRAFLQSQPSSRTDYINAILIQSHTSRSGYLMTQFPLEDTVDDFWTMVCDYSCENIVVLGQPPECWLRENDSTASRYFSFRAEDERITTNDLAIVDYQVTAESNNIERTVRIFTMKRWLSELATPPSDSTLLLLLEQLDSRRKSDDTKPVVVMCRDGCKQSGLFCCISNIRDQMKMDDETDIFQTARQLKIRRPEALADVKQYQYCYTILGQYLDSTDIYIN